MKFLTDLQYKYGKAVDHFCQNILFSIGTLPFFLLLKDCISILIFKSIVLCSLAIHTDNAYIQATKLYYLNVVVYWSIQKVARVYARVQ